MSGSARARTSAAGEGCWFDLAAAERVRTFFLRFLGHSKGKWDGQPFELLDGQWRDVVAPLFGRKRADGTRRFRRGYIGWMAGNVSIEQNAADNWKPSKKKAWNASTASSR